MSKTQPKAPQVNDLDPPRAHSKAERVLQMLEREAGANIAQVMEATGWREHSVRAAITGLKKRGYQVVRRRDGETSTWAIVSVTGADAR